MQSDNVWTDDFLNSMRLVGDPLADAAAASIFGRMEILDEKEKEKFSIFIREFASKDFSQRYFSAKDEFSVPTELDEYFSKLDALDFTHDQKSMLERASDFFLKHGPAIIFSLAVRSLLKQYAHVQAIQVLRVTTLLEKHTHRRIIETMQFVMDVMSPDWHHPHAEGKKSALNTNHAGINSIQKLRLVHAMIRQRINHKVYDIDNLGDWDDKWGSPINQEDMIFANQTFSIEVIQGLKQMGIDVTDQETQDYFGAWQLIGRALGIHEDLLTDTYEEGLKLQDKIYERHFTLPNSYGPTLSEALINWLATIIPFATRKTIISLVELINGEENKKLIEDHLKINLEDTADDILDHLIEIDIPGADQHDGSLDSGQGLGLQSFFGHFITSLLKVERGGKSTHFRIGDGFASVWNINQDAEKPSSNISLIFNFVTVLFNRFVRFIMNLFKK